MKIRKGKGEWMTSSEGEPIMVHLNPSDKLNSEMMNPAASIYSEWHQNSPLSNDEMREVLVEAKEELKINYKFNEKELLEELRKYIDATYSQHYSGNSVDDVQTFEVIAKESRLDRGLHFATGAILKYADRVPLKAGEARKDLWKAIHFGLLALYCFDKMEAKRRNTSNETD